MKLILPTMLAATIVLPATALAGSASDAVRFFYSPPTFEADPNLRDRFIDPATTKFEQSDQAPDGEVGCIDGVLALDAQDYDEKVIEKTLKLDERVSGDQATVTATLSLFDGPEAAREIVWSLSSVGGDWKVSDIESKSGGWKLSELDCQ